MTKTRSFKSRGLQSVRLPEDVAFPESVTEVTVVREGARVIVSPVGASWDDYFDSPGIDLPERDQPEPQEREALFGDPDPRVDQMAARGAKRS